MTLTSDDAIAALTEAAAGVGLEVVETHDPGPGGGGVEAYLLIPRGNRVPLEVKRLALGSAEGLSRRLRQWDSEDRGPGEVVKVLVADRVTGDAREVLRSAGWSWLDLRGHLHLNAPGLYVDTDVAAQKGRPTRSTPFAGRAGIEVAVSLLLAPDEPAGVRQIAARIGRSPSTVSEVISALPPARTSGPAVVLGRVLVLTVE
ncbi:hypothetical protein HYG77_35380 (plasmid) [Rhodococcus sp. ZPP]|uniref:hypothetical protein n=1 Tax=Rhodococcus sp. ZPP TaxID=2749906 RepID=UPI001AD88DA7|nr:hypothetical protein [Rhodococcus sp. ZPP]QTJ70740.1 hypothetical protein HYG77_35380 [Rhodococcus sp. ZPP]